MKTTSKLVVLLLVGICLVDSLQAQALGPTADCSTKNAFLTWLDTVEPGVKKAAVDTNRPAGGWEVCDTTWGTTGTCCDVTKLKSAFNKRITIVKNAWERFINGLRRFKAASAKLKSVQSSSVKTDLETMIQAFESYDLQGLTAEQAAALVTKLDSLDTDLSTFKTKATACFEATKKVRGAIFCSGCLNGNSFTGNDKELKFKFKSGTCNEVIKFCTPVWNYMYTIHAQLTVAVELIRKAGKITGSKPAPPKLPNSVKFGNLASHFTDCPTGEISTLCTQIKLDGICGVFISFKNPETLAEYINISDLNTAVKSRLLQDNTEEPQPSTPEDGTGSLDDETGISLTTETKPVTSSTSVDASNAGNEAAFGNIISLALMALWGGFALIM